MLRRRIAAVWAVLGIALLIVDVGGIPNNVAQLASWAQALNQSGWRLVAAFAVLGVALLVGFPLVPFTQKLDLVFKGGEFPYFQEYPIYVVAETTKEVSGRLFRVGILNRSWTSVDEVMVAISRMDPSQLHYLPMPLGTMNSMRPVAQPGSEPMLFFDVVMKTADQSDIKIVSSSQLGFIDPKLTHKLRLTVSGRNIWPRSRWFEAHLDPQGELRFRELQEIRG